MRGAQGAENVRAVDKPRFYHVLLSVCCIRESIHALDAIHTVDLTLYFRLDSRLGQSSLSLCVALSRQDAGVLECSESLNPCVEGVIIPLPSVLSRLRGRAERWPCLAKRPIEEEPGTPVKSLLITTVLFADSKPCLLLTLRPAFHGELTCHLGLGTFGLELLTDRQLGRDDQQHTRG